MDNIKRSAGFRKQSKGDREWWEKDPNAKRSHLVGLDGRRLHIRSAHSAPNTLLQSAGALVMKMAVVILDQMIRDAGYVLYDYPTITKPGDYDVAYCGNIHDEVQLMVKEEHAEAVGQMIPEAIRQAGEAFNFRCPLTGEYSIGIDWSETH
jgi:DNA polymerase I-like protein with 3'-5' exonuclease and polymerase domains